MSDNYVKFQSSTLNGYLENNNFNKKLNQMLMPAHLPPSDIPQSNNPDFSKENLVKNDVSKYVSSFKCKLQIHAEKLRK
jgi:type II restriction/modification system DNA methylase subunit YeeA